MKDYGEGNFCRPLWVVFKAKFISLTFIYLSILSTRVKRKNVSNKTNQLTQKGVKVVNERILILVLCTEHNFHFFFKFHLSATQSQPLTSRDLVVSASLSENLKFHSFVFEKIFSRGGVLKIFLRNV